MSAQAKRITWKSVVLSCVLWLAVGAVATVLVAWTCVLVSVWREGNAGVKNPAAWGTQKGDVGVITIGFTCEDPLLRQGLFNWGDASTETADRMAVRWSGNENSICVIALSAGWPVCALEGAIRIKPIDDDSGLSPGQLRTETEALLKLPGRGIGGVTGVVRALPIAPHWQGMLADSAFWGAVLLVVVRGPVKYRSFRARRNAGKCPKCRYPLMGLPRCPECGASVGGSASAPATSTTP